MIAWCPRENNKLGSGEGPRPPSRTTTIPPPSLLPQTHRVLGISSSMAAAVAAAPLGPAPYPLLPPKLFERLWLRNNGVSRLTGGYLASFFGSNYTIPPGPARTMKPQYKMAASRDPRSIQRSDPSAQAQNHLALSTSGPSGYTTIHRFTCCAAALLADASDVSNCAGVCVGGRGGCKCSRCLRFKTFV